MNKTALIEAVQPICQFIQSLDLNQPDCISKLDAAFPMGKLDHIRKLVEEGIQDGWLCPRGQSPLTYGRLQKSTAPDIIGIDTVDMDGSTAPCAGPGHEHPTGEVDLCFSLSGDPDFDGNHEGWTVYPPKSWHVPTVSRGRMAILYFLPKGAIRFGPPQN